MSGTRIAIVVVLVLVLCCVLGALGGLAYRYLAPGLVPPVEAAGGPAVVIESPRHGDEVVVGQIVQVFATGQDLAGITHMELWVDGQAVEIRDSALPGGTNPFPILANWQPRTPGNHTIVVRAYNTADVSGQASISVNAVEAPDISGEMPAEGCEGVLLQQHEVEEGDTLESVAAQYEVTVEEILACNPGLEPAVSLILGDRLLIPYLVTPDEEEEPPPEEQPPSDPPELPPEIEPGPGEELPPEETEPPPDEPAPDPAPDPPDPPAPPPPPPPSPIALEFEALELETDQDYLAVYCNVSLQDNMERVPVDVLDFLDPLGPAPHIYWDIASELSGVNSVPVAVLSGETLNLFVNCHAFVAGELIPRDLGSFTRQHAEGDWTGNPMDVWSEGGVGQFRVRYRICQGSCDPTPVLNRPFNLQYDYTIALGHHFTWDWDDDPTVPTDGFRLYREGVLLYEQAGRDLRFMSVTEQDVTPWCDEIWTYTLTAYEGILGLGPESLPSDPEARVGDPCAKEVEVTFVAVFDGLWSHCILNDCPAPLPDCSNCAVEVWYGSIYANGVRIERQAPPLPEPGDPWIIMADPLAVIESWHIFPGKPIAELFTGQDGLTVFLGAAEDLTLGLSLTDWDLHDADSLICEGAETIDAADLFNGGPGEGTFTIDCWGEGPAVLRGILIGTVDVLP